ncbi:MAG TPA: hypothetical protein VNS60_11500 [Solirubrobacterales bacterium]|nr:hypothetical protein [Solirubrobacterales bacterium]
MPRSRVVNDIEFALATSVEERKIRAAWKRRHGGGAIPLLLVSDDPEAEGRVQVLGPQKEGPLRRVRAEALLELIQDAADLGRVAAIRRLAEELERLDADGVPGLIVRGLGTAHLYGTRLPAKKGRWTELEELGAKVPTSGWREALEALGYEISELPRRGFLAKSQGKPALVIHPYRSAAEFARLDEAGRLPEGALLTACDAQGAPFGMLVAKTRMRLLRAAGDDGGASTRYLELDCASLEPQSRPLLGLLSPPYLAGDGFADVLHEARDYGSKLRERLDRALRERVLPVLGRELGRWAQANGRDVVNDDSRAEIEAAALTFVFRALFLLYAESAGYLPMNNHTYSQRSLTRIAERAAEELGNADRKSPSLWRDIAALVEAMRTGQKAWNVPAYNGDLFAADGFDGAKLLEVAAIPDAALGPALVSLARDEESPEELGVDFSGLEIGHLGHIYEGLLSLRLTVADRDFSYDPRTDRYLADSEDPDVREGELFWQTNEGGRKGGGVYYTRSELVRHLVRRAVRPAFEAHLERIRETAESDPAAAAAKLFDFYVIDPACGSAHFLVEVVDELADQLATLLGELALPTLREELDSLRAAADRAFGLGVEDTALLKRLALKRCVYGVDLSPMGAEIAKVSLWLGAFVPGLSLAYLDHNVQVGNSLIGVARPDEIRPPGEENQEVFFGRELDKAIMRAAEKAAKLREIDDRTPDEVEKSRAAAAELREEVEGAERVLDLWTAGALGIKGARDEALNRGEELIAGAEAKLGPKAKKAVAEQRALHWPLAFAEVFARENPGFDVIVGNPPWEEVTVEELAFYALYRPGIRSLPEKERKAAIEELKRERPELPSRLTIEQERLTGLRSYFGAVSGYSTGAGDPDVYKYFCQRYRELLRQTGRLGVVLPRWALGAKGSIAFRAWLFDQAPPERVDFLVNTGLWMFDTHAQYTVALLVAQLAAGDRQEGFEVAGVANSAAQFDVQSTTEGFRLSRASLGPDAAFPLLHGPAEATLLAKLRSGSLFPFGANGRWSCFSVRELDETKDSHLWKGATEGWPLWKGESFEQYAPLGREVRVCPLSDEVMQVVRKVRPGTGSLLAEQTTPRQRQEAVAREIGRARVVYRRVTRGADSRTIIACLIPPQVLIAYTGPYLAFVSGDDIERAACLGVMNSLAFDWQARRYVELSLSMATLESLHLPDLDDGELQSLAKAAARLSCPDERFAEFAAATEVDCGPLDEGERLTLRADIDARVARAWELSEDELEIVFSDFTLDAVPEDYREAVRKRFAELG